MGIPELTCCLENIQSSWDLVSLCTGVNSIVSKVPEPGNTRISCILYQNIDLHIDNPRLSTVRFILCKSPYI